MRALGATSLYLFGSTARDESGAGSDIDLFIEYDRSSRFSLVELVGIRQLLEGRLGRSRVDLTTRDSLDPLLRNRRIEKLPPSASFDASALVRPALRAILDAIDGVENATRGKTARRCRRRLAVSVTGSSAASRSYRRPRAAFRPELQAQLQPRVPWPQIMGIAMCCGMNITESPPIWNVAREYLPPPKAAVLAIEAELKEK